MSWLESPPTQRSARGRGGGLGELARLERELTPPPASFSMPDEVNDHTARRVLKSAARHNLPMGGRPACRVQPGGNLTWRTDRMARTSIGSPRSMTLAQTIVADVSCLADRPGHGFLPKNEARTRASSPTSPSWAIPATDRHNASANTSARGSTASLLPSARGSTATLLQSARASRVVLRHLTDVSSDVILASREPSSRAEAISTSKRLQLELDHLAASRIAETGSDPAMRLSAEIEIWSAAFSEVTRQVYVHCLERGELLGAIHAKYTAVVRQLLGSYQDAIAEAREETARQIGQDLSHKERTARSALMFMRAAHATAREAAANDVRAQMDERMRNVGDSLDDAYRARSRLRAFQIERDAAVAHAEELQQQLELAQTDPNSIYECLISLKGRPEASVLRRALTRFGAPVEAVLAQTPSLEIALPLVQGLISPLSEENRRVLVLALAVSSVPPTQHEVLCDDLLYAVAPSAAAPALGAQIMIDEGGATHPREAEAEAQRRAEIAKGMLRQAGPAVSVGAPELVAEVQRRLALENGECEGTVEDQAWWDEHAEELEAAREERRERRDQMRTLLRGLANGRRPMAEAGGETSTATQVSTVDEQDAAGFSRGLASEGRQDSESALVPGSVEVDEDVITETSAISAKSSPRGVASTQRRRAHQRRLRGEDGDRVGVRPTSLPILYRLAAILLRARIAEERRAVLRGGSPSTMDTFINAYFLSYYGVQSLAYRYVEELKLGLKVHAASSVRLALFACCLGIDIDVDGHRDGQSESVNSTAFRVADGGASSKEDAQQTTSPFSGLPAPFRAICASGVSVRDVSFVLDVLRCTVLKLAGKPTARVVSPQRTSSPLAGKRIDQSNVGVGRSDVSGLAGGRSGVGRKASVAGPTGTKGGAGNSRRPSNASPLTSRRGAGDVSPRTPKRNSASRQLGGTGCISGGGEVGGVSEHYFWSRFAELNEIFLPASPLMRGVLEALDVKPQPVARKVASALDTFLSESASPTSDECTVSTGTHSRCRKVVLARHTAGPFVSLDRFMSVALTASAEAHEEYKDGVAGLVEVHGGERMSANDMASLLCQLDAGDHQEVPDDESVGVSPTCAEARHELKSSPAWLTLAYGLLTRCHAADGGLVRASTLVDLLEADEASARAAFLGGGIGRAAELEHAERELDDARNSMAMVAHIIHVSETTATRDATLESSTTTEQGLDEADAAGSAERRAISKSAGSDDCSKPFAKKLNGAMSATQLDDYLLSWEWIVKLQEAARRQLLRARIATPGRLKAMAKGYLEEGANFGARMIVRRSSTRLISLKRGASLELCAKWQVKEDES